MYMKRTHEMYKLMGKRMLGWEEVKDTMVASCGGDHGDCGDGGGDD
jgi:hypothetical protein